MRRSSLSLLPTARPWVAYGEASVCREADRRVLPAFHSWVIPESSKLAFFLPPYQVVNMINSVLGLVGPVSVYCQSVRKQV